jgi:D-threo-aldose 1-dehydrogenase
VDSFQGVETSHFGRPESECALSTASASRPLGRRTDVVVSGLGLGTAMLGNLYREMSDADATALVRASLESGVTYFDTAPHYGLGLAERRLGDGLATAGSRGAGSVVSTKVGRLLESISGADAVGDDLAEGFAVPRRHRRRWDFSAAGVERSLAESEQRLGGRRIDIALLHDPDDHLDQALHEALPALVGMRDAGTIGAVGVGMTTTTAVVPFVESGLVDVVLLAGRYTLLEQSALGSVLSSAERHGVDVVIGGVFNSGLLARSDVPDEATYDYVRAPADVLARARAASRVCAAYGVPLPAAAIQFVQAHPAVVSVLLGAATVAELADDLLYAGFPIPDELWPALRADGLLADSAPTPERRAE